MCVSTYVLWDLDVGEGVLGGLGRQSPGAEGGRDDGQTGGRHHFSLKGGGENTPESSDPFLLCLSVSVLEVIRPDTKSGSEGG